MKIIKFLTKEIKEIAKVTLFFLISFSLILVLVKLFLAEYSVDVYVFTKILIGSLVAAKAVIIVDQLKIVKSSHKPRYLLITYKTSFYTLAVLLIGLIEKIFDSYKETKNLGSAIFMIIQDRNMSHFFAVILCLAIVFSLYNIFDEINTYFGKGNLYKFFVSIPKNPPNL
jgi:hypothetical protein